MSTLHNAVLFLITIVTSVVLGYFAHKKHWKIVDYF